MPWVFLDAFVLAAPPTTCDAATCDQYMLRLLDLHELDDNTSAELLISVRTAEVLFETNSYPLWDRLPAQLYPHRTDIMRIMDALLTKSKKVEDALRISYVLLDRQICAPDSHLRTREPSFVEHHHQLLALMWVQRFVQANRIALLLTAGLG